MFIDQNIYFIYKVCLDGTKNGFKDAGLIGFLYQIPILSAWISAALLDVCTLLYIKKSVLPMRFPNKHQNDPEADFKDIGHTEEHASQSSGQITRPVGQVTKPASQIVKPAGQIAAQAGKSNQQATVETPAGENILEIPMLATTINIVLFLILMALAAIFHGSFSSNMAKAYITVFIGLVFNMVRAPLLTHIVWWKAQNNAMETKRKKQEAEVKAALEAKRKRKSNEPCDPFS